VLPWIRVHADPPSPCFQVLFVPGRQRVKVAAEPVDQVKGLPGLRLRGVAAHRLAGLTASAPTFVQLYGPNTGSVPAFFHPNEQVARRVAIAAGDKPARLAQLRNAGHPRHRTRTPVRLRVLLEAGLAVKAAPAEYLDPLYRTVNVRD
jgi:hypothetical protein